MDLKLHTDTPALLSKAEVISVLLLLFGVHSTTRYNYLLFHSLAELFSIFIAITIFIIAINCWQSIRNQYVLFVGVAYLFVGLLDIAHTLSFRGMPIFTDYDYYAPQFWIAARAMESISMLLAFGYLGNDKRLNKSLLIAAYLVVTSYLIASILYFKSFPICFVAGEGITPFKKVSEYLICGVLLLSITLLYQRRHLFDSRIYRYIGLSLVLMIAAELCFTLYLSDAMSDAFNEFGHLFKIGAFYFIYKAVIVTGLRDPISLLFRNLKASEESLIEAQQLAKLGKWECLQETGKWMWSPEIFHFFAIPETSTPSLELILEAMNPQDQQALRDAFRQLLAANDFFDLPISTVISGEIRYAQIRGKAVRDEQGQVYRLMGTLQDVSLEHHIQEALAIAKDKEKFELLMQTSGDGIYLMSIDGIIIEVNDKFCEMLGYVRDELIGKNVSQLNASFSAEELKAKIAENFTVANVFETQHRRKDGTIVDVEISAKAINYDKKTVLWNASRDISIRKQAEFRLKLAASVFTHANEGIMVTDPDGTIVEVNDTFTDITGYSREETLGQNPRLLQSHQQSPEFYSAMWHALIGNGRWVGELWNQRKNGEIYAEMLNISTVRDAHGNTQHYVALFNDITPMKNHERQLEHIAHYDPLTNLPNRVLMADRLQQAMLHSQRHNHSVAIAYLDLDGFKAVNDKHGHDFGDELLVTLARRMKDSLREGDSLARIGGDEFIAVLLDMEQPLDYEPVLARLLQAASAPTMVRNIEIQISSSIGVTFYPQDNADAEQLIRHADQAMYQAKQAGKNRYCLFDVAQDMAAQTQRKQLDNILHAFGHEEFVLYYQPKVNMSTGAVVGVEALIRWQHPEQGLLPPAAFLPVIEDHPFSVALGEWVIDTALAQISAWHANGLDISVSVNIGARQLQQHDFTERLSKLLAAHSDVSPDFLELEILETSALEDMIQISKVMYECREIGVHFALDDFGTGYSSLTYLKNLPAELLKIDQSFVRDMLNDQNDLALVKGVIGLATAFRRKVIAEGVETAAHGTLLLSLGCELAQGYGIARPMPADKMPQWAATWQTDPAWAK